MGFDDEDFDKVKWHTKEYSEQFLIEHPKHKGKRKMSKDGRIERMSNTQLYKQAGNSIVVNVLEGVLRNLFLVEHPCDKKQAILDWLDSL